MAEFYGPDLWLAPIPVTSSTNQVVVTEDPNGTADQFTVTLTPSPGLNSGEVYYGFKDSGASLFDPAQVYANQRRSLSLVPLYTRLEDQLNANSPNGHTYTVEAVTPPGSSLTNSGLRVSITPGEKFSLDFNEMGFTMDARLFGYASDPNVQVKSVDNNTSFDADQNNSSVTGPCSRYYCWQSPRAAYEKRHRDQRRTFASSDRGDAYKWRWTRRELKRQLSYYGVAGAHVWPDDRAGRQTEADRGGLPVGDTNNNLKQLFELACTGDQQVVIAHNDAASAADPLEIEEYSDGLEAAYLDPDFASVWSPQEGSRSMQHAGEKYDLTIPYTVADPDGYTFDVTPYRH